MADDIIYLTQEGKTALEERYKYLVAVERPAVSEEIKVARGQGDLSENAEYDAAKNKQMEIEQEIKDLEIKLAKAQVIDEDSLSKKVVSIGSTVQIYDKEFDEKVEYQIVGTTEVDVENNKISNECPLGKGLIGHKKGEELLIETPGGVIEVKILKIK